MDMEKIFEFEEKKTALINKIRELDNTKDKQFSEFFKELIILGFFSEEEIDDTSFEQHDNDIWCSLPMGEAYDITVGFYMNPGSSTYWVGIDPTYCFDKTSKCSIIVCFGELTDEELNNFYSLFRKLIGDLKEREEWFAAADTSFCGEYFRLGEMR